MQTYQDLTFVPQNDNNIIEFVMKCINEYKASEMYKTAVVADQYFKKRNTTIVNYEKLITTITGEQVPDKWSANHKVVSGFFKRFVTQQVQFLLGNGVSWEKDGDYFGDKFDNKLQKLAKYSLIGGIAYGFWNLDKLQVFSAQEFLPLWDEETGALRAGIRWWQISPEKPLRATLYEEDGYTEFEWKQRVSAEKTITEGQILNPKRGYVTVQKSSEVDGTEIVDYTNYSGFPVIPLWGNPEHQSELVGIRDGIDEYDIIKNGYGNDLDNAQLYWIIKGAGGMDDIDLVRFLERLKLTHAAAPAEGQDVQAQTIEIPYEAREKLLDRIERDLYRDYMALNTEDLSSRNATATEIKAAYEPMNGKADDFEYQILEFLEGLMEIAGVEDTPTFTRSYIVNVQEEVQTVVSAASYLSEDYVTEKVLTILGDGDKAEDMLEQMSADEIDRLAEDNQPEEEEEMTDGEEDRSGTRGNGTGPQGSRTEN